MSQSFKDTFSLDYLSSAAPSVVPSPTAVPVSSAAASVSPSTLPYGMAAVLDFIGAQLLAILKASPDKAGTLLDLAQKGSLRLEAVLPVTQYLSSKGLIERTVEDSSGNDTYKLTPAGESSKL